MLLQNDVVVCSWGEVDRQLKFIQLSFSLPVFWWHSAASRNVK